MEGERFLSLENLTGLYKPVRICLLGRGEGNLKPRCPGRRGC